MPEITPEIAADVDVLLNLLAFLPDPADDDNRGWWEVFAEHEADREGAREKPAAHYIIGKMVGHGRASSWWDVRCIAMYTLMFFEEPTVGMIEHVSRQLGGPHRSGRRYVASLCSTAWRIYVATDGVRRRENREDEDDDQ